MSFQNLKRNRDQISKLIQAAEATGSAGGDKKSYVDERIWKPTVDKAGNGYAVLRFLPPKHKFVMYGSLILQNSTIPFDGDITVIPPLNRVPTQTLPSFSTASESNLTRPPFLLSNLPP